MDYSSDIINDISDKAKDIRAKVGNNIENAKSKYFYEKSLELDKEYAKIEQKNEELRRSGRLMTDEEKKVFRNAISLILISISEILLFMAKKEQTISR